MIITLMIVAYLIYVEYTLWKTRKEVEEIRKRRERIVNATLSAMESNFEEQRRQFEENRPC